MADLESKWKAERAKYEERIKTLSKNDKSKQMDSELEKKTKYIATLEE